MVQVSAATTSALQTGSSIVGSVVSNTQVQDIPLNERNFINLVQAQPGVNAGQPSAISSGNRRRVFAEKHNALSVLAVWTMDICIGMRATMHLYLHRSQYDSKTGFGSILEKGAARAFQICKSGRAMAAKYDKYIDGLVEFGLPPSSRSMPSYFLKEVDQKLEPVSVTPASIREILGGMFRFDANWARRLVKTMAIERNRGFCFSGIFDWPKTQKLNHREDSAGRKHSPVEYGALHKGHARTERAVVF